MFRGWAVLCLALLWFGCRPATAITIPAVVQTFNAATIQLSGTSTLTLSITNSNASALTTVGFTDTFPAGLVVAATPALTNSCNGSVSGATSGGATVTLAGGSMAANSSCSITFAVTAPAANVYTNTAGGITSDQWSGAGAVSNSATLSVLSPPTIAQSFSTSPVYTLGTSQLTVTITNPNATAITGLAFTDTYPAGGFGNVLTPITTNTCGGIYTANGLASSMSLSGGTLAGNSSCSVSVTVASTATGIFVNTTGSISSTNAGTGGTATATLIVNVNLAIAKAFSPTRINTGATSTLTLTIVNPLNLAETNLGVTDNFPAGLVVATAPAMSNTCFAGTVTGATSGSNSITLSGATLAILSSCQVTVAVTASTPGNYTNTTLGVHSTQAGTVNVSNAATLQVVQPATIAKSFSPSSVFMGGTSTLSLTITNPNGIPLTGLALTDSFPTNLVVTSNPTAANSCAGTLTGITAGSTGISLAGGGVAANASCTVSVLVTSALAGNLSNTVSGVSSNETSAGTGATGAITFTAIDLKVKKSHATNFVVGTTGTYTITVDNSAGTAPTTGVITVTDTLPTGLTYLATGSGGSGWTCGASGQVITCTSSAVIAAAGTGTAITLNVNVAPTAVPSVVNRVTVSGGGETAAYTGNNTASDYTLASATPQSTLSTSGQQSSAPGTTVFYTHIFTAGYAGNVVFSAANTASPAITGWSSAIFQDTNCNGVLDGTEGVTAISGSVAVAAGGQVCLVLRVFIPGSAAYGAQNQTLVTATFTPTSTGSAAAPTQTDLTIASGTSSGLTLQKTVRNVTTGGTAAASNSALPGNTLEYSITYLNAAAKTLGVIVVDDRTPAFTNFVSAQCVLPLPASLTACNVTTQPTAGNQGSIVWTMTGSLLSGASGSVLFRVTLQ